MARFTDEKGGKWQSTSWFAEVPPHWTFFAVLFYAGIIALAKALR